MTEFLVSLVVIIGVLPIFLIVLLKFSNRERKWIVVGFLGQIFATIALIWVHTDYYGYGDMLSFHRQGMYLANLMRGDFAFYGPEVFRILVQQDPTSSLWVHGIGHSTGTMYAMAGFLNYIANDSLYGISFLARWIAFFGLLAMYAGLKTGVPEELQIRVLFATLFVPSVVFWSGGLIKEAIAIGGLGFATLAIYRVAHEKNYVQGLLLGAGGILLMGLSKGYLLVPFAMGSISFFVIYYARSAEKDLRAFAGPGFAVAGLVVAIFAILAIGQIFPRYSITNLAAEAAHLQEVGARVEGGSNFALVDEPGEELSLGRQLLLTPIALITSLFRPFIFEVHNPFSLLSAIEAMAAMTLLLTGIYRRGLGEYWRRILFNPTLMYCLIIVILMGIGVGLTTTNMGSLSRYRIPMMPMYFTLLLLLWPSRKERKVFRPSRSKVRKRVRPTV